MERNYKELSNEKLLKRRNSLKAALFGLGLVAFIAISISTYFFISYGFKDINIIAFLPLFILPITFLPMLIILGQTDKEIKARNIK